MLWDETVEEEGITIIDEGKIQEGFEQLKPTYKFEAVEGEYTEFYINTYKGD